jgi:methylenetetrahydrofolate dehydrogenase (NADP+)/methenyltetrahydrofolate cyclohydrolase
MNNEKVMDGKALQKMVLQELKEKITTEIVSGRKTPRIDVIIVGNDPASQKYVDMKKKAAEGCGFLSIVHNLPEDISQEELEGRVEELNKYNEVDGFFIQLPLPKHIDSESVLKLIDPAKDIDGLTSDNLGMCYHGDETGILSATPRGIIMLLDHYNIEVKGLNIVIVGWSKIVGMPLMAVLSRKEATVTVCNDKTVDLKSACKSADIVISATGVAGLITGEHVKDGAILIDVGFSVDKDGKVRGDIEYDSVLDKTSYITPVPGGVGPMTVAALLTNAYEVWMSRDRS